MSCTLAAYPQNGIKCRIKIIPNSSIVIIRGDKRPQIGQNATIKKIYDRTPSAVAIGIMLGQYISCGIVTFSTNGSHITKYSIIDIFATNRVIARFKNTL